MGGNTGSDTISLYKDSLTPTITATLSSINMANEAALMISGTCSEAGGSVTGDLEGLAFSPTPCNGSTWSVSNFDVSSVGDNPSVTLTVDMIDKGGNPAARVIASAQKDIVPPVLPVGPLINGGTPFANLSPINSIWTISTTTDPELFQQRVETYSGNTCSGPPVTTIVTFSTKTFNHIALGQGPVSFKVIATDDVGNEAGICSNTVTFDNIPPTSAGALSFSQPSLTTDNTLDLSWSAATDLNGILDYEIKFFADPTCSVAKDTPQNVGAATTYTTTPLTDGNTYYTVTAQDNATNTIESVCSSTGVTIDTTPPNPPTLNPTHWIGPTNTSIKRASTNIWTYSDPSDVNIIDVNLRRTTCGGEIVESRPGISKSLNSATFDFPSQGTYFYEVTAYDLAGNSSASCSSAIIINQNAMSLGGEYIDGFEIDGEYIYALTDSGLEVYDISSPTAIDKTATLRVEGFAPKRAAVNGDHIYLYNETEMYIWTTASGILKSNPTFVKKANINLTGARDHAFSATYMWINSGTTLYAIDLSTPGDPVLNAAHTITPAQINCKAVEYSNASAGAFIYVACNDELYAYDITTESSPGAPTVTSYTENIHDLLFDSTTGHMYATGPAVAGHLKRFDVRSPFQSAPSQINAITGFNQGNAIGNISGGLISLCKITAGTADMINIATLAVAPLFSRKLDVGAAVTCNRSIMSNGHLFAFTDSGIHVTSTAGGIGPVVDPNPYFHRKTINRIAVDTTGAVAFSADRGDHAIVYDLSSVENPEVAHTYTTGNYRAAVFDGATKTVVTIRGSDILKIVLTDPGAPSNIGTISHGGSTTEGTSLAVDTVRRHVFYGNKDGEIRVFNLDTGVTIVSNKPACSGGAGDEVLSMLYKDNYLFFTCKLSLKLLSYTATNPAVTFNQAGTLNLPSTPTAGSFAHNDSGDFLYIPLGTGGIQVASFGADGSLSNGGNPNDGGFVYSTAIPNGSSSLLLVGKQLSLNSYDITDPAVLTPINSSLGPGENKDIVPIGSSPTPDYIYSAAGSGGIQVYRVTDPANIHQ